MPNFSFESKVRSVDLKLEINDISEESANRIIEYIQAEIAAADPFAKITDRLVERDVAKVEPLPEIKENRETVAGSDDAKLCADKFMRIKTLCSEREYNLLDRIWAMFEKAKRAPGAVENEWLTAREMSNRFFAGLYDSYMIGNVMGRCVREGMTESRRRDKGATKEYRIPIAKTNAVREMEEKPNADVSSKPDTVSDRLREYRERSGLSIADVADLIKYPESVIKIWEAGENVPSREGKAQLESLFGKHIFDGVQKPVIW